MSFFFFLSCVIVTYKTKEQIPSIYTANYIFLKTAKTIFAKIYICSTNSMAAFTRTEGEKG